MPTLRRLWNWARTLGQRSARERDLDREVRGYADLVEQEKLREGMAPEEARRSADGELGGAEQVKESVRSERGGAWLEILWKDARYAARLQRRTPGFTAVAVLTLALGIGANTAIFSVVHAVVLRPLPFRDARRLVAVTSTTTMFPDFRLGISWPAFEQVHSQVKELEQFAGYQRTPMNLTGTSEPARLTVARVTGGFFDELGEQAVLGRLIESPDLRPGQDHVAVISEGLWRTRFGADPGVIGRAIELEKQIYTIKGVASKGRALPDDADLWVPLMLSAEEQRNLMSFAIQTVGRLRPGATLPTAESKVEGIAARIAADFLPLGTGYSLQATTLLDDRVGEVRTLYLTLLAAATFVLLIACANLANLLLARGAGRQREMGVRLALGATRARLVRQAMVESVLLSLLGGAAGALLAAGGVELFRAIAPGDTPRIGEVSVDSAMLWFAFGVSLLGGAASAIVPALRASRIDPNFALKEGAAGGPTEARSKRHAGLGRTLVVVEISLAFVLLAGAVLATESLSRLLGVDTGFRTDHLLRFSLPLPAGTLSSLAQQNNMVRDIEQRIEHLPGVEDVGVTAFGMLADTLSVHTGIRVEDPKQSNRSIDTPIESRLVSPGFFRMLGTPVVRGREFTASDAEGSPGVAIVNQTMARSVWGTVDVVGRHISQDSDTQHRPIWMEIVGVVSDTRDVTLSSPPQPEYFQSALQVMVRPLDFLVRTTDDPAALAPELRQQVWAVMKDQPITNLQTMDRFISLAVGQPRLRSILLGIFAGIGVLLAVLGVYGVVAYSVARRRQEIGIRMALGARPADILGMVLRQGIILAALGTGLGGAAALALARVAMKEFYGVRPLEPLAYLGTAAAILLVVGLASYVPARRAMRLDPIAALRHG